MRDRPNEAKLYRTLFLFLFLGQVAYREAITRPAEVDYVHKKQSGGSGQFARVKIEFSPLQEDDESSDLEFVSEIKGGVVPKEYIPGVQKVTLGPYFVHFCSGKHLDTLVLKGLTWYAWKIRSNYCPKNR